jgi:hypothetical protein
MLQNKNILVERKEEEKVKDSMNAVISACIKNALKELCVEVLDTTKEFQTLKGVPHMINELVFTTGRTNFMARIIVNFCDDVINIDYKFIDLHEFDYLFYESTTIRHRVFRTSIPAQASAFIKKVLIQDTNIEG